MQKRQQGLATDQGNVGALSTGEHVWILLARFRARKLNLFDQEKISTWDTTPLSICKSCQTHMNCNSTNLKADLLFYVINGAFAFVFFFLQVAVETSLRTSRYLLRWVCTRWSRNRGQQALNLSTRTPNRAVLSVFFQSLSKSLF